MPAERIHPESSSPGSPLGNGFLVDGITPGKLDVLATASSPNGTASETDRSFPANPTGATGDRGEVFMDWTLAERGTQEQAGSASESDKGEANPNFRRIRLRNPEKNGPAVRILLGAYASVKRSGS